MFYVYIIQSQRNNKLYKGLTQNLVTRVKQHNNGEVLSTKSGTPWKLIYYESFISKKDARREELFLKTGKGRERLKYLLEDTLNK